MSMQYITWVNMWHIQLPEQRLIGFSRTKAGESRRNQSLQKIHFQISSLNDRFAQSAIRRNKHRTFKPIALSRFYTSTVVLMEYICHRNCSVHRISLRYETYEHVLKISLRPIASSCEWLKSIIAFYYVRYNCAIFQTLHRICPHSIGPFTYMVYF